jgi:hypothetical protein
MTIYYMPKFSLLLGLENIPVEIDQSRCTPWVDKIEPWNKGKPGLQTAWNKGITMPKQSAETNQKRSETLKKHWAGKPGNRKGCSPWNAGTKGLQVAWNKGKTFDKAWNTGYKQPTVSCPHCGKEGGEITMKQWHFDRCKFNI